LQCYSQREIAEKLGITQPTVKEVIDKVIENGNFAKSYQPSDFTPQLYDVWTLPKYTGQIKYPGNIPPEILENLLYYYTEYI